MTNRPVKQETRGESFDTQNTGDSHVIDCIIVRIMKAKQKMKHSELISEILSSKYLKKPASTQIIKTCVESLIERAYIKRTENIDEYEYIA